MGVMASLGNMEAICHVFSIRFNVHLCVHAWACECLWRSEVAIRELEFQAVVTEPGSFARAISILNC